MYKESYLLLLRNSNGTNPSREITNCIQLSKPSSIPRKNIVYSPNFSCHQWVPETNSHYLLHCHRFNYSRNRYMESTDIPMNLTVDRLLFGSLDLTDDQNNSLFLNVHSFTVNSKRFISSTQFPYFFLLFIIFFFNYFESNIFYIKHQIFLFVLFSYTFFNLYQNIISQLYMLLPLEIYIIL